MQLTAPAFSSLLAGLPGCATAFGPHHALIALLWPLHMLKELISGRLAGRPAAARCALLPCCACRACYPCRARCCCAARGLDQPCCPRQALT